MVQMRSNLRRECIKIHDQSKSQPGPDEIEDFGGWEADVPL